MASTDNSKPQSDGEQKPAVPSISLPKGGGAIRGVGEKFAANPVTGTGSMSVPIATSPGRSGFGPQLSLSYDSGAGNGPFGLGWSLSLPHIARKTEKGLPKYLDSQGQVVGSSPCDTSITPPGTARYKLNVAWSNSGSSTLMYADLKVTWPAAATAGNESGSTEMFAAFDRN